MNDLEILEMLVKTSVFKCMQDKAIEFNPLKRKDAFTYNSRHYDAGVVVLDINAVKGRSFVIGHELSHNKHKDTKLLPWRALGAFLLLIIPVSLALHFFDLYWWLTFLSFALFPSFISYFQIMSEFRCDRESVLALKELGIKSEMSEVFEYFQNYKSDSEEEGYSFWAFVRGRCTHPPVHMRIKKVLELESTTN